MRLKKEATITSFFYTFQIAKCIAGAVCCCFLFIKTTLFTTMFAITIFGVVIEKHVYTKFCHDLLLCE